MQYRNRMSISQCFFSTGEFCRARGLNDMVDLSFVINFHMQCFKYICIIYFIYVFQYSTLYRSIFTLFILTIEIRHTRIWTKNSREKRVYKYNNNIFMYYVYVDNLIMYELLHCTNCVVHALMFTFIHQPLKFDYKYWKKIFSRYFLYIGFYIHIFPSFPFYLELSETKNLFKWKPWIVWTANNEKQQKRRWKTKLNTYL